MSAADFDYQDLWATEPTSNISISPTSKIVTTAAIAAGAALLFLIGTSTSFLFFVRRQRKKIQDRKAKLAPIPYTLENLLAPQQTGAALGVHFDRDQPRPERDPSSSSPAPATGSDLPTTPVPAARHEPVNGMPRVIIPDTIPRHPILRNRYGTPISEHANPNHSDSYSDPRLVRAIPVWQDEDAGLLMTDQDDNVPPHMYLLPPDYRSEEAPSLSSSSS